MSNDVTLPSPKDLSFGGPAMRPDSFEQVLTLAQYMAKAGPMVGASFRGNPGACMGIIMQAVGWGMNPFQVSQKAYVVNDVVAYEGQLVAAVIHKCAPVQDIDYVYEGEGSAMVCRIVALDERQRTKEYTSPPLGVVSQGGKSPLWKRDPQQQLGYYAVRAWARRHFPHVIMGVYTEDERVDAGTIEASALPDSSASDTGFLRGQAAKEKMADLMGRMQECENAADLDALEVIKSEIDGLERDRRLSDNRIYAMRECYEAAEAAIQEAVAAARSASAAPASPALNGASQ